VPINPGNSGGGVFNVKGELIGIATLKVAETDVDNMAYAIPSNVAKLVSENLIYYSENYGNKKMKLFSIGLTVSVSSVEMSYNEETGEIYKREILEISEIKAGSAAAVSECRVGDVIVSVEISGKKYSPQFIYQLAEYKYLIRPGDSLKYYLERDGASKTVEITVPTVGGFEFLK
jgi:serine protease Do